jgi:predicted permease
MPIGQFLRRVHYLLNRRRLEQELTDDIAFHREMASRHGGAPFGNVLRLREDAREAWGWTWLDRAGQDLRFAMRILRKSPAFTLTAILMLAIGIGVNVAVFSMFNIIVLRPLPIRDPGTLVKFRRVSPEIVSDNLPYAAVAFYRAHARTLSTVLAVHGTQLAIEQDQQPLAAQFVTADLFQDLGGATAVGRPLDPRDDASGASPVAVLSHAFWRRRFASDTAMVGRSITLNGKPVLVVGVATETFSGLSLDVPDAWVPITQLPYLRSAPQVLTDFSDRGAGVLMWGRVQSGQSVQSAEEELEALAAQLHADHPDDIWRNERLLSEPGGSPVDLVTGRDLTNVVGLVGALGLLILVVACSSLGSLVLARGVARDREIAIRISVGAGRGRLTRQLLTENLLLAGLGAGAGLFSGYVLLRVLIAGTELPLWMDPTPDWRVVGFATGMGLVSALLFGLMPAVQAARRRLRASFSRQCLIGAQVAASCVLLIVAGLLVRALIYAVTAHPGFDYRQVMTIDPNLGTQTPAVARAHLETLRSRLASHGGIEAISIATNPPLGNRWSIMTTRIRDRMVDVHVNGVDPSFFRVMGIPLLRGRNLAAHEPQTIVVSEALARLQWPGEDPLGKSFNGSTVIGIVGNAHLVSPEDAEAVEMYGLAGDDAWPSVVMLVKASRSADEVLPFVTATARSIDPLRFPSVRLMTAAFQQKLRASEYAALSTGVLGIGAVLVACVGLVGLVSYSVTQRTKEIGVRLALGARPSHVVAVVLQRFSGPLVVGLVVGIGAAAGLSQVLRRVLYGVSHLDPTAYLAGVAVFGLAVALAVLAPARRALQVDPIVALRCD